MKSYTDIEQSKILSKILPLESADMIFDGVGYELGIPKVKPCGYIKSPNTLPCWSLVALFNVLPVIIGDVLSENALRLRMDKSETDFNVWYENLDNGMAEEGLDIIKSNPVDACYEMIIKLKERNLI